METLGEPSSLSAELHSVSLYKHPHSYLYYTSACLCSVCVAWCKQSFYS